MWYRRPQAALGHEFPIAHQGRVVIAAMNGHERVGGRETPAGSQGELGIALDRNARLG